MSDLQSMRETGHFAGTRSAHPYLSRAHSPSLPASQLKSHQVRLRVNSAAKPNEFRNLIDRARPRTAEHANHAERRLSPRRSADNNGAPTRSVLPLPSPEVGTEAACCQFVWGFEQGPCATTCYRGRPRQRDCGCSLGARIVAIRVVTRRHSPAAEPAKSRTNRQRLTLRALIR
jgi:hypothetical protein